MGEHETSLDRVLYTIADVSQEKRDTLAALLKDSENLRELFSKKKRNIIFSAKRAARDTLETRVSVENILYFLEKAGYFATLELHSSSLPEQKHDDLTSCPASYAIPNMFRTSRDDPEHIATLRVTRQDGNVMKTHDTNFLDYFLLGTVTDILNKNQLYSQLEEQILFLRRSHHMILHDSRNPLFTLSSPDVYCGEAMDSITQSLDLLQSSSILQNEKSLFSEVESIRTQMQEIQKYFKTAKRAATSVHRLLDLLCGNGLNYNTVHKNMEVFSLPSYAQNAIELNANLFNYHGTGVRYFADTDSQELMLIVNPTYFDRLCVNIGANAARYAIKGTDVYCATEVNEGQLVITFANCIPDVLDPSLLKKIRSGKFSNKDSASSSYALNQGLGIGLVKELVEEGYRGSFHIDNASVPLWEPDERFTELYSYNVQGVHINNAYFISQFSIPLKSLK